MGFEAKPLLDSSKRILPLERSDKLKIFGILSVDKNIAPEVLKDRCHLGVVVSYTMVEALVAIRETLLLAGKDPSAFEIPYMHVLFNVEDIIGNFTRVQEKPSEILPSLLDPKQKSVADLSSYVLYVFNEVGTPSEKELANLIIERFKQTNADKK